MVSLFGAWRDKTAKSDASPAAPAQPTSALAAAGSPAAIALCPFFGQVRIDAAASAEVLPGLFDSRAGRDVTAQSLADGILAGAVTPGTLADVTVAPPWTVQGILSVLRRWGVAVLPGAVAPQALHGLEADFAAIMADGSLEADVAEGTRCARIDRSRLDAAAYPAVAAFFSSLFMRAVADGYFGAGAYEFNHKLFVHQTDEMRSPFSERLHFDVTRMLKFWVYLSDGSEAAGAMRAVPGSHLWLRLLRREFSERMLPRRQMHNDVDETRHPAIPITGPAGTVFIFDTDMAHGAMAVQPGHQRRIIRGHCTETDVLDRARRRG